ncbi:MAG: hypothetical protein GY716_15600 [bacterium]|nr:hypothetical protein [bacterium]
MMRSLAHNRQSGLTFVELLIGLTITLFVILGALAAYLQGNTLKAHAQDMLTVQSNLRLGLDWLSRDVRMAGFAVPVGQEIGGTAIWTPAVFHASPTALAFRSDVDGGAAEIVCTPKSGSSDCPTSRLRLDSIEYFQELNCKKPGTTTALPFVAVIEGDQWKRFSCTGFGTSDGSISASGIADELYPGGQSEVATIEQVYYRYVASSAPPTFGRLERYVRYANSPDSSFPPSGVTWEVVARNVTDFSFEYRDENNTVLSGSPLSGTNLAAVRRIVIFIEGLSQAGPQFAPQMLQMRTEILARNLES